LNEAVIEEDQRKPRKGCRKCEKHLAHKRADAGRLEKVKGKVPDMAIPAVMDVGDYAIEA